MTAILGIRANGVSYIAADSRATVQDRNTFYDRQTKLFKVGAGVVGFSDWCRLGHLVQRNKRILGTQMSPEALADKLLTIIEEDGWVSAQATDEAARPKLYEAEFMLATRTGLYHYDASLTPSRIPDGAMYGIGDGSELAVSAGLALWNHLPKAVSDPAWTLKQAITTASKLSHSVGLPVYSEQVK